jgi:hypothetical protein
MSLTEAETQKYVIYEKEKEFLIMLIQDSKSHMTIICS